MQVICTYGHGDRGRVGILFSCFLFLFHFLLFSFHAKASHHFHPFLTPALPRPTNGANWSPLEFTWQSLLLLQNPSLPALGCSSFYRMLPNSLYSPVVIVLLLAYLFLKVSISLMRFQEEERQVTKINYKFRLAFELESVIVPLHLMYILCNFHILRYLLQLLWGVIW